MGSIDASNSSCPKPLLNSLQLRRYSERLENPWFSALLTARPPAPVSVATRRISRVGQTLLEGGNKKQQTREQRNRGSKGRGKEELEAYLKGKMEAKVPGELPLEGERMAGYCAICNGQLGEGWWIG